MGLLAAKQRRLEDADSLFRKSLRMRGEWYGLSHPLVAEVFDALASLACSDAAESPDVVGAEEMFRQALLMREQLLGASHLSVANTLFKLGKYWCMALVSTCSRPFSLELESYLAFCLLFLHFSYSYIYMNIYNSLPAACYLNIYIVQLYYL